MAYTLNAALAMRQKGAYRSGSNIRLPCPLHGGSDALSLTEGRYTAVWHCHAGCDKEAVREALVGSGILLKTEKREVRPMPKEDSEAKRVWCARVWQESKELSWSAQRYFEGRGIPWEIVRLASPGVLRWSGATSPQSREGPELVARVTNDAGKGIAIHRTIFLPDGSRKRRAVGVLKGGAIRLFGDRNQDGTLVIAEGIETALSYRALHPDCGLVWSLISAGGIERFTPPDWVKSLTVAADFDSAGIGAWEKLSKRMTIPCRLRLPGGEDYYGCDWNGLLDTN